MDLSNFNTFIIRFFLHFSGVASINLNLPFILQLFKDTPQYKEVLKQKTVEKMPTERCARLMAVSMANNLEESWISEHPTLIFYYMGQYCPTLQTWYVRFPLNLQITTSISSEMREISRKQIQFASS